MIIKKDKDITIKLTIMFVVILVFLTIFTYVAGWLEENIKTQNFNALLITCLAIVGEIIIPAIISFTIIVHHKQYYEITENGIKLYNKEKLVFELNKSDIVRIEYVRFRWVFVGKIFSAGLNIQYVGNDNIKPTLERKGVWKKYILSASYKQVIKMSQVLKIPIYKI